MEVNFFGLIHVTKKAMEVMREQKPSGSSLLFLPFASLHAGQALQEGFKSSDF